jgi:hypothetical protein
VLEKNSPAYFKRNLDSLVTICMAHHIPVLLLSVAWSKSYDQDDVYRVAPNYIVGLEQHNQCIREIWRTFASRQVAFLDFSKKMPAGKQYFLDPVHMNAEGSRIQANIIGDFIVKNYD